MTNDTRGHDWLVEIARLDPARPPGDVPLAAWRGFLGDARKFVAEGWLERATQAGWDVYQLFACDRERPWARLDHCGLVWLIGGGQVVALDATAARVQRRHGLLTMPARILDPDFVRLPW